MFTEGRMRMRPFYWAGFDRPVFGFTPHEQREATMAVYLIRRYRDCRNRGVPDDLPQSRRSGYSRESPAYGTGSS